jgi:predicted hydrolase (HD superfamily)
MASTCSCVPLLQSLKKKVQDRAFAAGVDREEVSQEAAEFGVDLKEHTQFVIEPMRGIAAEFGLEGEEGDGVPRRST